MSPEILADSFVNRWNNEITAILTIVVAGVLVYAVDRAFRRRRPELDPVLDTRLRFVRRLVEAVLFVVGLAIAISQFAALDRLAASILASGAIAAAVVGFASRQVLANVVAGVMLAVTQPIRIGDLVTLDDDTGVVEDIRLTYTFLRTGTDARIIVPNELLAASVLRNDSIVTDTVAVETSVWVPHEVDERRALEAVAGALDGATVRIGDVTSDGVLLTISAAPVSVRERAPREAELRAGALAALRGAGLR
ncbi:MAG TPA: mechanosensitive ion channel domain-containing protein [Solirubrobacteraceae bacterium]|jgi:small-conductance mechanosensitive channel|nr:mechanosensitive ion channel domain-containing protein [Solirubrobacteraceae bacterium]